MIFSVFFTSEIHISPWMTELGFCLVLGNIPTKVSSKAICLCSTSASEMQIPSAACFFLCQQVKLGGWTDSGLFVPLCPTHWPRRNGQPWADLHCLGNTWLSQMCSTPSLPPKLHTFLTTLALEFFLELCLAYILLKVQCRLWNSWCHVVLDFQSDS